MNSDFRLSIGYFTHTKIVKLSRRAGDSGVLAHIRLLSYAAQERPTGILRGMDLDDISIACAYAGDIDELLSALLDLRLLDKAEDGTLSLHDWAEHNPWAVTAPERSEAGKKGAEARWAKDRERTQGQRPDTLPIASDRNADLCGSHKSAMPIASNRNAPILSSPFPSFPNDTNPSQAKPSPPTRPRAADPPGEHSSAEEIGMAGMADASQFQDLPEADYSAPGWGGRSGFVCQEPPWQDKAALLCRCGVSAHNARRAGENRTLAEIEQQIAWLPFRSAQTPAILTQALKERWEQPPEAALKQKEAAEKERRLQEAEEQKAGQETQARARQASAEEADAAWESLAEAEQQRITAEATTHFKQAFSFHAKKLGGADDLAKLSPGGKLKWRGIRDALVRDALAASQPPAGASP